MKRIALFFILMFLLAYAAKSQTVDSLWNGYLSPFVQTGGTAPNFNVQGQFVSNGGFTGSQIELSKKPRLIVYSSNKCYELPFTALSGTGSIIAGTVIDRSGQLSAIPSGSAIVYQPSNVYRVGPFPTGVSASLQGCLQTYNNLKIDSIQVSGGSGITLGDKQDIDVVSTNVWVIDTNVVTTIKIAASAVDSSKIAANAVRTSDIGNAQVTMPKIAQSNATSGQVIKWNGSAWAPAADNNTTYTAGSGININGSNVISNTGVTSINGETGDVTGYLKSTDPIFLGGDVSGEVNNVTVEALNNIPLGLTTPTTGQVLKYNGSTWSPAADATGGGGVVEPLNRVILGTGTGSTSDADFTFNPVTSVNRVNGILAARTADTVGVLNISVKQLTAPGVSKPGIYISNSGQSWWINERIKNPSVGWNNKNSGDWFSGEINNGLNGSSNFAPGVITDTLPNIVWREGQNWQQAPAIYNSIETNWWGGPTFSGTGARNVYEYHYPQVIDSAGIEHRPSTGYFEKRFGGQGGWQHNVTIFDLKGWYLNEAATFTMNRNSEAVKGQMNVFNDSLYSLNLSDIRQNTVAYFGAANKSGSLDPTGKSNFITVGGNGAFNNVVGFGALYVNNNQGGDLDALITTQTGSSQVERVRVKGGGTLVGIGTGQNVLQELHVNGDALLIGSLRANAIGDSAAMNLKYSAAQTTPILNIQYNNGITAAYAHVYNTNNPSLIFGRAGTFGTAAANNTVFGLTGASFPDGAGNNTLTGSRAGNSMNGAYENTADGAAALQNCTTCFQNNATGYGALQECVTCYQNTADGRFSQQKNQSGAGNTSSGILSLATAVSPSNMMVHGTQAAQLATTANNSLVLGGAAARQKTTITGSVILGNDAASTTGSLVDSLVIANSNTTEPLISGSFANNTIVARGRVIAGLSSAANTVPVITGLNNTGKFNLFKAAASPNSVITGTRGDVASVNDGTTGSLWVKVSGVSTLTGWERALTNAGGTSTSTATLLREESFTATAAQTAFTIAYNAPAVSGTSVPVRVYRNGVRLFYVASGPSITQFTYSGTTVTTAANAAGDIITVEYLN